MRSELVQAVQIVTELDLDYGHGTRRERNEQFGMGHLNREAHIPEFFEWLWDFFWRVSSRRSVGPSSPDPLSVTTIMEFAFVEVVLLSKWDVATLCEMDSQYIETFTRLAAESREMKQDD